MAPPTSVVVGRSSTLPSAHQPLPVSNPTPNPQATPLLSSQGVANLAIYYVPRRFDADSKLHRYLARKCPTLIFEGRSDYNLYEVLTALKRVIASEKLFDVQNPTVVICDVELEEALDVKALHVSEIREQVCKQFHPIIRDSLANLTGPQQPQHLGSQALDNVTDNNSVPVSGGTNISTPAQTTNLITQALTNNGVSSDQSSLTRAATAPAVAPAPSANAAVQRSGPVAPEPIILPSWASSTANAVTARQNSTAPFNIEGRYLVKPAFLKVLRAVEGVNQSQVVFPYREVANILSKYIMMHKDKFFDLRNIRVALVENDPLGKAFGVKAFARCQVTALMRSQLMPFTGVEPVGALPEPKVEPKQEPEKRKRDADVSDSSTDDEGSSSKNLKRASLESAKRHRHRSRNISITIRYGANAASESSSEETIYSAQGYETTAICDVSDDDTSDTSSDDHAQNDLYNEENIYRVEYEIDSGSDNDRDRSRNDRDAESDENSEIEDVLIASAVTEMLNDISDFSNWADSDSDTDDDFALSTYDPELQDGADIWKCVNCGQPNTPYMRYCHRCWEERKGWVPERANPRRRKKTEKSKGLTAKMSGSGKSSRSEQSDSAVEHEVCSSVPQPTCSPKFARSLSQPTRKVSEWHDPEQKAVSDGDADDNKSTVSDMLAISSGPSSQSCDSGFSQESQTDGSQEILSPPDEADQLLGSNMCSENDSDFDDDDDGKEPLNIKKRRQSFHEDFVKKQKLSAKDDLLLSSRRDELPQTVLRQKNIAKAMMSVLPTPETDLNSPSTSSTPSSSSNQSFICTMCCARPKDACFIHGQISHQVCCYQCAKMIFKNKGTCPVCRRRIEKITRNIVI